MATLEEDLRKAVETGDVLFVVGTGVSIGATRRNALASWTGLIQAGLDECEKVAGVAKALADTYRTLVASNDLASLLSAAQFVGQKLGAPDQGAYRRWLRETVGGLRASDRNVLAALSDLPAKLATTNYDDLLEEVTQRPAVTWRQGNEVERVLRGDDPGIVHLHGHWRDSESVVLGIADYARVLGDGHAQAMLKAVRAMKTLVFVGCAEGLADPNVGALLKWTRGVFAGSEYVHYLLAREPEVEKLRQQHPPEERLQVVSYGKDFTDLAPFLRRLAPGKAKPGPAGSGGGGTPFAAYRDAASLEALAALLREAQLPWDLLRRHFQQSVPEGWAGDLEDKGRDNYPYLVTVLSWFPARSSQGRTLPLLEFVQRLSASPDAAQVKASLRQWLVGAAKSAGVELDALKVPPGPPSAALYLLVKLERAHGDQFRLEAWLGDAQWKNVEALFAEEKRCKLEGVPGVLGELWRSPRSRDRLLSVGKEALTVEFLLPRELLFRDVEQWKTSSGDFALPLGKEYRVAVRPLERVYADVRPDLDETLAEAPLEWRRKWKELQQGNDGAAPLWLSSAAYEKGPLLDKLAKPEVTCVALTQTPPTCPDEVRREVLRCCIGRGIPVVLWSRLEGSDPKTVRAFFKRLVARLHDLPDKVRAERARADASKLGHHVTLLWDDPDRLPPDAVEGVDYVAPLGRG